MCPFNFNIFISFLVLCYLQQVPVGALSPTKPREIRSEVNLGSNSLPKKTFQLPTMIRPRSTLPAKQDSLQQGRKIQRRGIPFQQIFLGDSAKVNNAMPRAQIPGGNNQYFFAPQLPTPKTLIKPNETEAERAERIHRSFDRLLTFVEIVGQVDNYVSSKWKNLVKTVSNFYEVEDEPYQVSAKRIYGTCSHA